MERLIKRREAAKILGIGLTKLDEERLDGKIAYVQYVEHGCVYFTEQALLDYIARCTHRAKPIDENTSYRKNRKPRYR